MASPGLEKHRKFRRLVEALGSRLLAYGALEALWQTCYESGDPVLGSPRHVEDIAGWTEVCRSFGTKPGVLFEALKDADSGIGPGFIEEVRPGVWQVHDLESHAPDYVIRRMRREQERRAEGRRRWERLSNIDGHCSPMSNIDEKKGKVGSTTAPTPTPTPKSSREVDAVSVGHPGTRSETGPASPTAGPDAPVLPGLEAPAASHARAGSTLPAKPGLGPAVAQNASNGRTPVPNPVDDPVVMTFPCQGKRSLYELRESQLRVLENCFPGIEVRAQLARLRARVEAPEMRKTHVGMWRAINTWLGNAVDWAGKVSVGQARNMIAAAAPHSVSPDAGQIAKVSRKQVSDQAAHFTKLADDARKAGDLQAEQKFKRLASMVGAQTSGA